MNRDAEKLSPDERNLPDTVKDNLDLIADFYASEGEKVSTTQNVIERISGFFARPLYFSALILFACGWIVLNQYAPYFHIDVFDPKPFVMLHGIIGFNGALITIAVLIRQNRLEFLSEKRAHLSLQATLLTERKATKIISLLEELRGDLPNVKNRIDPEAEDMRTETDAHEVLNAIDVEQIHKKVH